MADGPEVLVIGSGVIGMTTGLCLAEAGFKVRLVTENPPQKTTSAIAGALWGPYAVDDPRVVDWSLRTLHDLEAAYADRNSGVKLVRGWEASCEAMDPPPWLLELNDFELLAGSTLSPPYVTSWTYSAPIFDMPVYLGHLGRRLREEGVRVEVLRAPLRSLREATGTAPIIVNCTGLGARELVPDPALTSSWGQLVKVENPGLEGFFSDYPEAEEPTYFIAHDDHVILGGCIYPEQPDAATAAREATEIHRRCTAVAPELGRARILGVRSGLRPKRPEVRLERVVRDGIVVIHNYGHGGSGVTLSWGCAREVVAELG